MLKDTIYYRSQYAYTLMRDAGLSADDILAYKEPDKLSVNNQVYYKARSVNEYIDLTKKGLN